MQNQTAFARPCLARRGPLPHPWLSARTDTKGSTSQTRQTKRVSASAAGFAYPTKENGTFEARSDHRNCRSPAPFCRGIDVLLHEPELRQIRALGPAGCVYCSGDRILPMLDSTMTM